MNKTLFVQNIKLYCERAGVKPTVACRESGAGKDFLNQIVTRGQVPSVEKVQLLAQYLGVTVSELLGEIESFDVPDDEAERLLASGKASDGAGGLTQDELELVRAYRRATPKERALIDTMLAEYKKGTASNAG